MVEKNWEGAPVDPAWVEAEINRLHAAVDAFSRVMKDRLAAKAREGWRGWDDSANAEAIYTSMLAHAAGIRLARGHEADIANYAMMLWRFSQQDGQSAG